MLFGGSISVLVYFLALPVLRSRVEGFTDFCHADNRIKLIRHVKENCSGKEPTVLINIHKLHGNPFHSLHDTVWAVTHYLDQCLEKKAFGIQVKKEKIMLYMKVNYEMDMERCFQEPSHYDRWKQPYWGACILLRVALKAGINKDNIFISPMFPKILCISHEVRFSKTFRATKFRIHSPSKNKNDKERKENLGKVDIQNAFRRIQSDAFIGTNYERIYDFLTTYLRKVLMADKKKIVVLVYDRKDKKPYELRRKWENAIEFVNILKKDERLSVEYFQELPKSMLAQAFLFRRANIVITPHGAAVANSIFMTKGSTVLEIWKCCREETRRDPFSPRRWTGWHAKYVDINLIYLQCHHIDGFSSQKDLSTSMFNGDLRKDRWCQLPSFRVEYNESKSLLEISVQRHFRNQETHAQVILIEFVSVLMLITLTIILLRKSLKDTKIKS